MDYDKLNNGVDVSERCEFYFWLWLWWSRDLWAAEAFWCALFSELVGLVSELVGEFIYFLD